jgi:hypothetical protein
LLIKAKQQHGKNENKNTGLFINCMDFVEGSKINKKKSRHFYFLLCLGLDINDALIANRRKRFAFIILQNVLMLGFS